jgi:uncharacterized membrane protein YeiB
MSFFRALGSLYSRLLAYGLDHYHGFLYAALYACALYLAWHVAAVTWQPSNIWLFGVVFGAGFGYVFARAGEKRRQAAAFRRRLSRAA